MSPSDYPPRVWAYAREMRLYKHTKAQRRAPLALHAGAEAAARTLYAAMDAQTEAGAGGIPCQEAAQGGERAGLWTSDDADDLERAAALCRDGCPLAVRELCKQYASAAHVTWGVWGGNVRQQRAAVLRAVS